MWENDIIRPKRKRNIHVHSTMNETVHTKIATQEFLKVFLCISSVTNVVTCENVGIM